MAEIANPVIFDAAQLALIKAKQNNPAFTHVNWSDDDLEPIRSAARRHYRTEQKGLCAYCKGPLSLQSSANCHVEHIAPKSKYKEFMFEAKNLCVICADCNTIKRDQEVTCEELNTINNSQNIKQYPRSSKRFFIVHPHFDNYFDHIEIFGSHYYVDKTRKGHFTIGACKLNRRLQAFGWEAPLYEDDEVCELMNMYLETRDAVQKAVVLNKLRQLLVLL